MAKTNEATARKSLKDVYNDYKNDKQFANDRKRWKSNAKNAITSLFKFLVIIGICYVIVGPIIGIISHSFFSDSDCTSALVFLIPQNPTLYRYQLANQYMNYWPTMLRAIGYSLSLMIIQVFVCSLVGYGFARYKFPLKNLLFGCVVVMIVIPTHTIMLPLYLSFAQFDPFGLVTLIKGAPINLLSTPIPMYILTVFGCGLRSGLYIYIFNQFFRGLPKEIEEAAYVDGATTFYTYFRVMLVNAIPAVVTVAIFSMVWQYNDTFYANLFQISGDTIISVKIATLEASISNVERILNPNILELFMDAGIVMVMAPIVLIYIALQKQFIEGVERSGIVG